MVDYLIIIWQLETSIRSGTGYLRLLDNHGTPGIILDPRFIPENSRNVVRFISSSVPARVVALNGLQLGCLGASGMHRELLGIVDDVNGGASALSLLVVAIDLKALAAVGVNLLALTLELHLFGAGHRGLARGILARSEGSGCLRKGRISRWGGSSRGSGSEAAADAGAATETTTAANIAITDIGTFLIVSLRRPGRICAGSCGVLVLPNGGVAGPRAKRVLGMIVA